MKLVYDNRGEKLAITRLDLNDRIADAIANADLDPDQEAQLEKLLGKATRSSRQTIGWIKSPPTSWNTAPHAGNRASRCSFVSTR